MLFYSKKNKHILFIIALLLFAIVLQAAPMNGNYTIGGSSPDYVTINDAVNDLIANGVDGNVTFSIRTGTYNEQVIIPEISGTNSTNTINFKAESGDANDVIISHTATTSADNYIVRLDGVDYIDFHYLTFRAEGTTNFGTIFEIMDGTSNAKIRFNKFYSLGYNQAYSYIVKSNLTGSQSVEHLKIESNYFNDAYYGIYLYGYNSTSFSDISIENNFFYNQMIAVKLNYVPYAEVLNNKISDVNQGILLSQCYRASVQKNDITVHKSGIEISYSNDVNIINNSISADGIVWSGNYGMASGLLLYISNSNEVYYNSINLDNSVESTSSYAFSIMSGTGHYIKNNIISNLGKGNAIYFTGINHDDIFMDYNDIFVGRGFLVKVGSYNSDIYYTLSQFQTDFGENEHSVSFYPSFDAVYPLYTKTPWVNDKGTNISSVTEDIEGNPRDSSTPDLGCYEFTPDAGSTTPLSGIYSVGTGNDYENLHDAMSDLLLKGTNGYVRFDFYDGNYSGNYELYDVPSSTGSNNITFSLGSGDFDFTHSATSTEDNYLIHLMGGTTNYSFNYLTFEATGTTYARVFLVEGYNKFNILGGSINAPFTTSNDRNKDLIYMKNAFLYGDSNVNTTFNNGSISIYCYGDYDYPSDSFKIMNCNFNNNYGGIYLSYINELEITNNIFNEDYRPIQIIHTSGRMEITSNQIVKTAKTGDAIMISNAVGGETQPERVLIANNTIKMVNCSSGKAMYLSSISKCDVVYNSIYQTGSNTLLYATYDDGTNVYENNIFGVIGSGMAFETYGTFSSLMDYNDFYCEGTTLISYNNLDYANLSDFQSATSTNLHSLSVYPYFTSDMHTDTPLLNGAGIDIDSIIDIDMDGQYRTNPPDIGADSFTPDIGTEPLNGTYTIGTSKSDFSSFTDAAYALSSRGISGETTFLVDSGTYTEQVEFKQIYGADASKKVIFKSNTGIDSDVILQYGPTVSDTNYVVLLNGVDYIVFRDLTIKSTNANNYYNTIFRISGNAEHIQINSNTIHNDSDTTYGDGNSLIYSQNSSYTARTIYGNTFENGYYGYTNYYYNNGNMQGLAISFNSFANTKYPINISSNDAPQIYNNTMIDFTTAVQISSCNGQSKICNNKMITTGFADYYHSYNLFSISSCDADSTNPILIYNNTLKAYDNAISGLTGVSISNCNYVDFYYNTIQVENNYDIYVNSPRGEALYVGNGSGIKVKNNILAYKGNGLAYEIQDASAADYEIDYNDLYGEGLFLAQIQQDKYKTIQEIRDNSDYSDHSVKAPPLLDGNLYTTSMFLNGKGTAISEVTTDIEGNPRDSVTPDIGCLEFTPATDWEPMIGNYTIGTSNADYSTISEAIANVISRGKGATSLTFNIQNGTYNEQLDFLYIPQVETSFGYVTFQSESGNADDVIIQFDASNDDDNYLLKIIGSKELTFNAVTFVPQDASYNKIAWIKGYNEYLNFSNCIFEGVLGAGYNNGALIKFDLASFKSIWFANNEFNNGGYGVYYTNYNYPEYAHAFILTNNTFTNNYQSLYLKSISSLFIESNTFTNQTNTVMNINKITEDISIYRNFAQTSKNRCLNLVEYDGTDATTHRIANNYFNLTNPTQQQAYDAATISNTSYLNIFLNTFMCDIAQANSNALNLGNANTNMNIQDNIFANNNIGYAIKVQDDSGLLSIDHNLFYTQGANFAYWEGTDYSDLSSLQTVTSMNSNSILANPNFVSNTSPDLQSSSPAINGGITIYSITEDIYGTSRVAPYDIGAYEYVGGITPAIPQNVTIEIINGNTARISWDAASQATSYRVEYCDTPNGSYTTAITTSQTTVDIPITSMKKFYRVISIH